MSRVSGQEALHRDFDSISRASKVSCLSVLEGNIDRISAPFHFFYRVFANAATKRLAPIDDNDDWCNSINYCFLFFFIDGIHGLG